MRLRRQLLPHSLSIEARQSQVEDDEVRAFSIDDVESVIAVASLPDVESREAERHAIELSQRNIVFHDKDSLSVRHAERIADFFPSSKHSHRPFRSDRLRPITVLHDLAI